MMPTAREGRPIPLDPDHLRGTRERRREDVLSIHQVVHGGATLGEFRSGEKPLVEVEALGHALGV